MTFKRSLVIFSIGVAFLQTEVSVAQAKRGIDASSVRVKEVIKLTDDFLATDVSLGELFVGRDYEVTIRFANCGDEPITFADAESCCGIVLAFRKGKPVDTGRTSDFRVLISAKLNPQKLKKKVSMIDSRGKRWEVNLHATIKPTFVVEPSHMQLVSTNSTETLLRLRVNRVAESPQHLGLKALGGFLKIKSAKFDEKGIACEYSLSADALRSTLTTVERLAVVDSETGNVIAQLPFPIVPTQKVFHRPSRVTFRRDPELSKSENLAGRGVLVGDKALLEQFPDEGDLQLVDSYGAVLAQGEFVINSRAGAVASLVYKLPSDAVTDAVDFDSCCIVLRNEKGRELLSIESVRFAVTYSGGPK